MRALVFAPLLLVAPSMGCTPPEVPTPDDAAAYLGLAAGTTTAFASGPLEATVEVKQSSVVRDEALVFDVIAKESGFVEDDRTFTIAVGVEDTSIVRFFDCISRCGTPATDIAFVSVPLTSGDSVSTETDVALLENGVDGGAVTEKHTIVVGEEAEVTVPAGTFTGITVSWTRTRDGDAQTSLLTIAPETGIVAWTTFDGAELERK